MRGFRLTASVNQRQLTAENAEIAEENHASSAIPRSIR
jgi:hypothetical protein